MILYLMKVLIVEDEPLAASHLSGLIHQYESHIQILDTLESVREVVAWLEQHKEPDLLFLDIHLADGLSFAIFDQIQVQCPVIFTTAYDEYALQAFRTNSIDYLLKPVQFEQLAKALDRYVSWFQQGAKGQKPQLVDMELLRQMMNPAQENTSYKKRFVVKKGEHLVSVPVTDILYFYSEDKATLFKTTDNKRYLIDPTLTEIETQVDPNQFFRVNRGVLVSLQAIEDIISFSNRRLKLHLKHPPESEVLVAREKVSPFKEWLDQ